MFELVPPLEVGLTRNLHSFFQYLIAAVCDSSPTTVYPSLLPLRAVTLPIARLRDGYLITTLDRYPLIDEFDEGTRLRVNFFPNIIVPVFEFDQITGDVHGRQDGRVERGRALAAGDFMEGSVHHGSDPLEVLLGLIAAQCVAIALNRDFDRSGRHDIPVRPRSP